VRLKMCCIPSHTKIIGVWKVCIVRKTYFSFNLANTIKFTCLLSYRNLVKRQSYTRCIIFILYNSKRNMLLMSPSGNNTSLIAVETVCEMKYVKCSTLSLLNRIGSLLCSKYYHQCQRLSQVQITWAVFNITMTRRTSIQYSIIFII